LSCTRGGGSSILARGRVILHVFYGTEDVLHILHELRNLLLCQIGSLHLVEERLKENVPCFGLEDREKGKHHEHGPALFAFHAADTDSTTGHLDALPLLHYRVKLPGCAVPNVGDPDECDYPAYTMCDDWTGGAFVDNGSEWAIMLLGYKGLGVNCYDEPPVVCGECTTDTCIDGVCEYTNVDCNDGLFCTGMETCDPDTGCISPGNPCAEGEVCDEETDECMLLLNPV